MVEQETNTKPNTSAQAEFTLAADEILVLRTSNHKRKSHCGFQWPALGPVGAPDWDPSPVCGGGLHGLPWGVGNTKLLSCDANSVWQVVLVGTSSNNYVSGEGELRDKCKFRQGVVVYIGDRDAAIAMLVQHAPPGTIIPWSTVTSGDYSTVTGGDDSTVTGGSRSTVTGGNHSTVTGGDYSTVTGGYGARLRSGVGSIQIILYHQARPRVRVVTPADAKRWYEVGTDGWTECDEP